MKTLFLDLGMGAAGDMMTAALYELIDDKEDFIKEINAAGIPDAEIKAQQVQRCGICGTHMQVLIGGHEESSIEAGHDHSHEDHEHCHGQSNAEHGHCHEHAHDEDEHSHEHCHDEQGHHHHNHCHRSMADVESIIDSLNISAAVKTDVKAVYKIIADAESKAHGMEVSEVHFHEVGMADAICDITAVCMLMERLAPDEVIASAVCTGFGHVHASHGVIPVPAPATANILEDMPSYEGDIEAELCTPTGAALVKYFADRFGRMPVLSKKKTGYGMGTKEFEKCNALRAVIGESSAEGYACAEVISEKVGDANDKILEFSLNVDDMTGEEIGFACERIFEAGAADVYTKPVYMKKNRPGILINVLAKEEHKDAVITAIFKYTTTLGIRQALCERYILKRDTKVIETEYGPVRKKVSEGFGAKREKLEYEDLAEAAVRTGLSLDEIKEKIKDLP